MSFVYLQIYILQICLVFFLHADKGIRDQFLVGRRQTPYRSEELSDSAFNTFANLQDVQHLRNSTKHILKPRVVGSPGHKEVRNFIVKSLRDLQWSVMLDKFKETVPIFGELEFQNIIATLNPKADRYLILSCHYDSKYFEDFEFLGATDSAVPCAMLLNLAKVLQNHLNKFRSTPLSLMLLFFDGEEAFKDWTSTDSIYGARHLAVKWQRENFLDKIDILVLLDLLGAPDPLFYSTFRNTQVWYWRLINIEQRLSSKNQHLSTKGAYSGVTRLTPDGYFQRKATRSYIEDDHTPFFHRNVPILHIIPQPFPHVWHTASDNESIIDYETTENLSRIIRIFTMEYLLGIGTNEKGS